MTSILDVYRDIVTRQKKLSNTKQYIKERKLKHHVFKNHMNQLCYEDLPKESFLGTVVLIKGSNIIEIYTWCDYNQSQFLQINHYKPVMLSAIEALYITPKDPDRVNYFLQECKHNIHPNTARSLTIQFVQSGFNLYTI
jgi:hypothetical protein